MGRDLNNQREHFWQAEILAWEQSRYSNARAWVGRSLQSRMLRAVQIIEACVRKGTLVDVGCGSGLLFEKVRWSEHRQGLGLDIAQSAVDIAASKNISPYVSFRKFDISQDPLPRGDCYIALGLTDWLTQTEVEKLFDDIGSRAYLISFSERKVGPSVLIHFLFRKIRAWRYGESLCPRYFSKKEILAFARRSPARRSPPQATHIVRDSSMAFGVLLTNLPVNTLPVDDWQVETVGAL